MKSGTYCITSDKRHHKRTEITPTEKKNETNILKKIKITKIFGDVNAPLRALYYLTITTFYGCNG
jgi:hypothetical protein